MYNRGAIEVWGVILIFLGILFAYLMFGAFSKTSTNDSNVTSNNSSVTCGVKIIHPEANEVFQSGNHVEGYIDGCGWSYVNGALGTVTLYKYDGQVIGPKITLAPYRAPVAEDYFMPDEQKFVPPYHFDSVYFFKNGNPWATEKRQTPGYLKFESSKGMDYVVPVMF